MRTPPRRPAAAAPTGGAGSGRAEPDPRRLLGWWRFGLAAPDLWRRGWAACAAAVACRAAHASCRLISGERDLACFRDPSHPAERRRAAGDVGHRLRRGQRAGRSGGGDEQPGCHPGRARGDPRRHGPGQAGAGSVLALPDRCPVGGPRQVLRLRGAGGGPDHRADAGDLRTGDRGDADRGRARHSARPVGRPAAEFGRGQDHHDRLDPRLLPADLLGRADDDHAVFRLPRLAADQRPRRDRVGAGHPAVAS